MEGNMSVANENRPVAIQVSGVKKMYRLGQIGGGTLQADLQSWWARVRGKEDPNTKIGEGERSRGDTFMALNGIDLTVYQGEAVGIIGSNGAGKSTLLKLLSKVTAPTEGEIDIYGRIASMLEVGTGFNGELTGRENVYMNGAILGMTKSEIDAKMEQIIEFSEVREFIDTPVKRYSSGMFVKLAFSVAAHLDAEIMIMDEVLAVGDLAFQKKCLDKMKEAADRDGRTVLYVSHNMNTVRQLCDRCIVLDKGKVKFEGDVEDSISIYSGNNLEDRENSTKQFTQAAHGSWYKPKLYIETARIMNDLFKIICGDALEIEVDYLGVVDVSNLYVRIVLLNDKQEIIGMANSNSTINVQESKKGTLKITLDTSLLSPGVYYTRFSVYSINQYGNHEYSCVLSEFISFELKDNPKIHNNMNWEVSSWGNVVFPSFKILNE